MYKKSFLSNFKKSLGINSFVISKTIKVLGLNNRNSAILLKHKVHIPFLEKFKTNLLVDKSLIYQTLNDIKFLKDNKTFRGIRHSCNLPTRGQRTHTNAKTKKRLKT